MTRASRALMISATCSVLVFGAGAALPIWSYTEIGHSSSREVLPNYHDTTLWGWLSHREPDEYYRGQSYFRENDQQENMIRLVVLMVVTGSVGISVYLIRIRRI